MALPVREMTLTEAVDTTRTGSAWYFDENGVFQEESTSDTARIDYDPNGGARLGLMAEGASTNLLLYSEDLSNGVWTKDGCSIGTPTTFATNISLDEIIEDTSTGVHGVTYLGISVTSGATATASVFLKAGARTVGIFRVSGPSAADNYRAEFDLAAETATALQTGAGSVAGVLLKSMGGGVYRLEVTGSVSGTGARRVTLLLSDGTGGSYAGDGSSNLYAGGLQLEELPGASSYIPTDGAQVTRAAETHELVSLDPWYRASGYSVAVQAITRIAANQFLFTLDDGTTDDRAGFFLSSSTNESRLFVTDGGAATDEIDAGAFPSVLAEFKLAGRFAEADCAVSLDGAAAVDDGTITLPAAATTARLGSGSAGTSSFYGWIQDLKYTTELWSDAELATESGATV